MSVSAPLPAKFAKALIPAAFNPDFLLFSNQKNPPLTVLGTIFCQGHLFWMAALIRYGFPCLCGYASLASE